MARRKPPGYYSRKLQELRDLRGNCCEECSSTDELQWAHIKPTGLNGEGRGQSRRYHDIKKHPDHYKLWCKPCHTKLGGPEHGNPKDHGG
jgi:hypothetical protein